MSIFDVQNIYYILDVTQNCFDYYLWYLFDHQYSVLHSRVYLVVFGLYSFSRLDVNKEVALYRR